jgi:1-acyl-sn-glycerol-3-phosphate acyltransferase
MNTVRALIGYTFFGLLVATFLVAMPPLLLLTWPFDRQRLIVGRCIRVMAAGIGKFSVVWKLRIEDAAKKPDGPFVAVANHESILDIFLVAGVPWEMKWVAKASLFNVPVVGWFLRMTGDIPVDRQSRESGGTALAKASGYLEHRVPVMFFPEGTRSETDTLRPFKLGAFVTAIRHRVPVLPIAVYGTRDGMPKRSPWIRPTVARAKVLPPIPTDGLKESDAQALADRVRAAIIAARDELIRRRSAGAEQQPA